MNWLGHPIFLLSMTAASLLASLALFLSVKRESAALRRRAQAQTDALTRRLEGVRRELARLEVDMAEREPAPVEVQVAIDPGPSMNMNKRAQALKMFRCGEAPERIASSLRMSRNEVELLLKVHQSVVGQY